MCSFLLMWALQDFSFYSMQPTKPTLPLYLTFASTMLSEHTLSLSNCQPSNALLDNLNITFWYYRIKSIEDYENHTSKKRFLLLEKDYHCCPKPFLVWTPSIKKVVQYTINCALHLQGIFGNYLFFKSIFVHTVSLFIQSLSFLVHGWVGEGREKVRSSTKWFITEGV